MIFMIAMKLWTKEDIIDPYSSHFSSRLPVKVNDVEFLATADSSSEATLLSLAAWKRVIHYVTRLVLNPAPKIVLVDLGGKE